MGGCLENKQHKQEHKIALCDINIDLWWGFRVKRCHALNSNDRALVLALIGHRSCKNVCSPNTEGGSTGHDSNWIIQLVCRHLKIYETLRHYCVN
jgi:hypothetical protein